MKNIPLGAVALWTLADKVSAGLQQLMAGVRKFNVENISRNYKNSRKEEFFFS